MAGDFRLSSAAPAVTGRAAFVPILVAWLLVVFDSHDLIVDGTVAPALATEWSLNATQIGTLGSLAFLGMMIRALGRGPARGRRGPQARDHLVGDRASVFTAACALVHDPWLFGALRLLAGGAADAADRPAHPGHLRDHGAGRLRGRCHVRDVRGLRPGRGGAAGHHLGLLRRHPCRGTSPATTTPGCASPSRM